MSRANRPTDGTSPRSPRAGGLDALLEEPPFSIALGLTVLGVLGAGIAIFAPALAGRPLPVPGSVLLLAVVWGAYCGGVRMGFLATGLVTCMFAAYASHFSWMSADPTVRTSSAGVDTLLVAVLAAAMTTLVGALRRRGERQVAHERQLRERHVQLETVKSNFLNVASHELRSPITVARGYAAMLADGSFGPLDAADVRRAAPVMRAKLDEMNALVDSMLDAARLEEERLVLQTAPVDLRDIVTAAVNSALPSLTPRHTVAWTPPRAPVTVDADVARLTIIITNLVLNAIKYSPDGGPIAVFLTEDGARAVVTVWDHGLGIADTDIGRLFTRFGRIVTPENSHILGTGLGLYLARELARLHGGDILVASEARHGSSFTLVLPILHSSADDQTRAPIDAGFPDPPPSGRGRARERARRTA